MPTVPFKLNQDRRHRIPKQKHKVTNWREYDASLRRRGSLTVWFTDEAIAAWRAAPRTTRGGQPWYSPLAILTALTLRAVFRLALRQTEGLIGSIIRLLGLELAVPDHTTLMWTATARNRFRLHSSAVRRKPSKPEVCPRRSRALARSCVSAEARSAQAIPTGIRTASPAVRKRRFASVDGLVRSGAPLCPACRAADAAGHHGCALACQAPI